MNSEKPTPRLRKYRPLDVKTWGEGFCRLVAWILVIFLAVVTGGLGIIYELKVLNKHDADFRDQDFDQRITNDINNRYHKNFITAEQCCNPDPLLNDFDCPLFPDNLYPYNSFPWSDIAPFCKPVVVLECADIFTSACNSARAVLYAAAGVAPIPRTPYVNCLLAGRVRVGVQEVATGRPYTLVGYTAPDVINSTLEINDPFNINATRVQLFVDYIAAAGDPTTTNYAQPSTPLSQLVFLAGVEVNTSITLRAVYRRPFVAPPPWNSVSNLWPWPGMNKRCPNTGVSPQFQLTGKASIVIPRFALARPQDTLIPLTVAGSTLLVGAWQVGPAEPPGNTVGGPTTVQVSYLTSVQAAVGMVPSLGSCDGWQLSPDPKDLVLQYTQYWSGPVSTLQAGTTFGPFLQNVPVAITDVAGPRRFQLPFYGGMWYIVLAFCMAFIWLVSTSLIILVIPLVWWNIRSNRGLPPIVYRYMKKYRGW